MENFGQVLLDPRVLVTFIVTALLGAIAVWIAVMTSGRRYRRQMEEQRRQQEGAVSRILDSVAKSKDEIIADYEKELRAREQEVTDLEKENKRLKDRVAQGGLLNMFGGGQREVISSLLLENEQLHELLAKKQEQLRDVVQDMNDKLISRLDEQVQESTNAIRYKQVLLSAFLQQEEARRLLDQFIAEGRLPRQERPRLAAVTEGETRPLTPEEAAEEPTEEAQEPPQESEAQKPSPS